MLAQRGHVLCERRLDLDQILEVGLKKTPVRLQLSGQFPARLAQLVTMMQPLDALVETDSDEQADDYRHQLNEETSGSEPGREGDRFTASGESSANRDAPE
jgi:hypothetical protein